MKYRWWHGVAFYAGVQATELALRAIVQRVVRGGPDDKAGDRAYYRSLKLPVFAPPGIAFPIAWSINSISVMSGDLHVMNLAPDVSGRAAYLRWRLAGWTLYACFNAAYFGVRSPINAALVTFAYTGTMFGALHVAVRVLHDRRAAWSLATTMLWLAIANPLAVTQIAWNHDPFYEVGPLVESPAWMLKPPRS